MAFQGAAMTKMMLAVLALALVFALPATAQDTTTQQNQSPDQNTTQPSTQANPSMAQPPDQNSTQPAQQSGNSQAAQSQSSGSNATSMGPDSQVGQTMTGTISADGKTFNSNGTSYTISNPNSVKPYANQPITVGYDMDTNNSIRITKVMLTKPQH